MFETIVPYWEMEDGKLVKLELLPVELGFGMPRSRNGCPRPAKDFKIIERFYQMSDSYETDIRIENGSAKVIVNI